MNEPATTPAYEDWAALSYKEYVALVEVARAAQEFEDARETVDRKWARQRLRAALSVLNGDTREVTR